MRIALAPMEGLVDELLRDLLTRVGGIDWCVTEFVRVCDRLLPVAQFEKLAPELRHGWRTRAGTPMHLQLLGSDPACLAENAALAAELGAPAIDLNFGCPAKTVNRSRGGAVLLDEPELLHAIVREVRRAVPAHVPVTAKMRLGYARPEGALECARALVEGGVAHLVVHARTKVEGYRPPAHWEWLARVREAVAVPVYANGEIWTPADWLRCREISGVEDVMLGRGLVSRPDLARQIAMACAGRTLEPQGWGEVQPLVREFWRRARQRIAPRYAPGRLKQWLGMLARSYPEAAALFAELRRENDCGRLDALLGVELRGIFPDLCPAL
ncbi:tRNA-dihydrouridine synthase C [Azotobacter vinelandii CA]|uniref:tRNA-dihydrouridine(16) synthase n=2 Tax=Azotobacter vinelandii TaxID=354 RepID=C1DQE5_AZOVD|nr:tRNA-dihydrouridine synthase [Azotobacter vinelandii]ACO79581.1 tRNA-dihydrouridine synthase C [Azotobacter vinelandii DJ]AGK13410.1 tRNA-dihydrouridine synthase C [Azotobacter vinelandii CA]AGK17792.1 tRNA-dihydrouridine synthase C [Azotobacter vinelandii CA6]WKN20456.1 tRNA-dihydrouridine synthase [Azotobacter vinelandii]SFX25509.1 tRNA-U20a,U20b-dihydrouridine synthase [Azotobacter vinelandii]